MQLTIPRSDLARVIASTARVVESRNTIPILGNLLLSADGGKLSVTATDLDIVVSDSVEADITTDGRICVDARLLGDIAKKAGGDVTLSLDGDKLIVKSGRSKFTLATLPTDDFPSLSEGAYNATFDVDLAALFAPVSFAISTEETRHYLNGIYLHTIDGELTAVATDGHRLARNRGTAVPEFQGIIVPRKAVGVVPKGTVSLSVSDTKIRIEAGNFTLISKLIDGTFPDYRRVIPTQNDKKVVFGSDDMRQAAGRVSLVSSERGRAVKLTFSEGQVALTVNNPEQGSASDEINVAYDGEPLEIGFNAAYLAELVGIFPSGDINLALMDSGSPSVFTSEKADGLLAVLMPMRV